MIWEISIIGFLWLLSFFFILFLRLGLLFLLSFLLGLLWSFLLGFLLCILLFFLLCLLFWCTFRTTLTKFKVRELLYLLFLLYNNNHWSSNWYWLICLSFLGEKSLLGHLKSNSCLIGLYLTYNISFFKSVSNILNPFNNFTLGHSGR